MADSRRFCAPSSLRHTHLQEPHKLTVHFGAMSLPYPRILINSASACRAKAASLREEARTCKSAISATKLLEIACHWDKLAAGYEQGEGSGARE